MNPHSGFHHVGDFYFHNVSQNIKSTKHKALTDTTLKQDKILQAKHYMWLPFVT